MVKLTTENMRKFNSVMDTLTPEQLRDVKNGLIPVVIKPKIDNAGITIKEFHKYVKLMII